MKLSQIVLLVKDLEEKIVKNTEEMEMVLGLMEIPKYSNSITLKERFKGLQEKTKDLIKSKVFYKVQVDYYDAIAEIKLCDK